jgi:hypothetical protein
MFPNLVASQQNMSHLSRSSTIEFHAIFHILYHSVHHVKVDKSSTFIDVSYSRIDTLQFQSPRVRPPRSYVPSAYNH